MRKIIRFNGFWALLAILALVGSGCGKSESAPSATPRTNLTDDTLRRFDSPNSAPGFTNFELTPVMDDAQLREAYTLLRTDMTQNIWNVCSERAHVWAYELWKEKGIHVGKVFLFYTVTPVRKPDGSIRLRVNTGNPVGRPWIWHAAPYAAMMDGSLQVLENFQGVKRPMEMRAWLKYQSNGSECVELKGDEREYLKYVCGPLTSNGECTYGAPDMIQVQEGGPKCFFRRVPSYYVYPRDIGNHDFLDKPMFHQWESTNVNNVYESCMMAMSGSTEAERGTKCTQVIATSANPDVHLPPEPPAPDAEPVPTPDPVPAPEGTSGEGFLWEQPAYGRAQYL